jgi:HlyD family secretion protein
MIAAALPVLSFLPDGRLKVLFFVGQDDLSRLKMGEHVKITCDACSAPIDATISFISSEPEFTPPVIYSLEERHKLVYLVEARPAPGLRPGQPVDVSLAP